MDRDCPPGWYTIGGVLTPGPRVADFAARQQKVRGRCLSQACNRRAELDPERLIRDGLGQLPMARVEQLWRCQRLDGCEIAFHAAPPRPAMPLSRLIGRANVRIKVRCRGQGCRFYRAWRVEEMIAGLRRREAGGADTDVAALGALMTSPCPLCKRSNWEAVVLWADVDSVSWKTQGEQLFATGS